MGKRIRTGKGNTAESIDANPKPGKPSSLFDTRVIYCGDLEQLAKLPEHCIDLVYIDPVCEEIEQSFNSNRNYEVFWGETKERRHRLRPVEHERGHSLAIPPVQQFGVCSDRTFEICIPRFEQKIPAV